MLKTLFLSTFPRRERQERKWHRELLSKFLSTFPRRERLFILKFSCSRIMNFYPRSHVGNDCWRFRNCQSYGYFYPRSHVGNDGRVQVDSPKRPKFLSTFPRRERRPGSWPLLGWLKFLSTFPRRERRFCYRIERQRQHISIHVPT